MIANLMKYSPLVVVSFLMFPIATYADSDDGDRSSSNRLVTPTLWAEKPIYFACNLTNVGNKPRKVTTRIINGNDGSVLLKQSTALAPRRTQDTTIEGLAAPGGPLYCDFTVKGSKKQYRGVAKLWAGPDAPNSSDITAVAAE